MTNHLPFRFPWLYVWVVLESHYFKHALGLFKEVIWKVFMETKSVCEVTIHHRMRSGEALAY